MSNDYNQIILERFFEDALEEGLSDADASRVAYEKFWEEDLPKLRRKYYNLSERLQKINPLVVKYPYKYWSVWIECAECRGEGTLCTGHPNDPSGGTVGCYFCNSEGETELTMKEDEYHCEADIEEDYPDMNRSSLVEGQR